MHPAACQLGGHGGQGEPGGKPRRRIEVDVDMVPGPADRLALVEGARLLVEAMEVRHLAAIFAATPDVVVSNLLRPPGEPVMSCLGWRRLPSSGGTRHRAET